MDKRPLADRVAALATLDEPIRRALHQLVTRSERPVTREAAAKALGLSRSTAAFHLDRLAAEGLLAVDYQRLTGRSGPGAGRPAKLYRRPSGEIAVTVPDRRYDLAAELLAAAVEESSRSGQPARDALSRLASETGQMLGAQAGSVEKALEDQGFEPRADGDGGLVLGNCPFRRLARQHTEIVCGFNFDLLRGVTSGAHDQRFTMQLDPAKGRCCVRAVVRDARSG